MINYWRPEQMLGLRLWMDCELPEGGAVASDPRLVLVTDGLISLLSLKALFWSLCENPLVALVVFLLLPAVRQWGGCFRCWCTSAAHLVENQAGIEECRTWRIRWGTLSLWALGPVHALHPLWSHPRLLCRSPCLSFLYDCVGSLNSSFPHLQLCLYFFSFLLSLLWRRKEGASAFHNGPTTIHVGSFTLPLRLCSIICFISRTSSSCFVKWQNLNNVIPSLKCVSEGKYSMGFGSPLPPKPCDTLLRDSVTPSLWSVRRSMPKQGSID